MTAVKPLVNAGGKIRPMHSGETIAASMLTGVGDLVAANDLSDLAHPATALTNLGLTANGASLVKAANYSAMRTLLGLVIDTDVTSKSYVDNLVQGLSWKAKVRAATTANGTLATAFANGQTIDGVTLVTGDRILIKNQSAAADNGIYLVPASGAPSRASDADAGAELVNAAVFISEGTTLADTLWTCTNNATPTLGSTSLTFVQFSNASGGLLASNNLSDLSSPATARGNLGLGTAAVLDIDTDGTLAANSDTKLATQKAVKTYVAAAVAGAGGAITVKDEGGTLSTAVTSIDFVGASVLATNVGGAVTVTVTGSTAAFDPLLHAALGGL